MNRRTPLFVTVFAILAILATPLSAIADSSPQQELAAVRAATAKYQNPAVAIADGYIPDIECVGLPGLGGMGYHWVNPALLFAPPDPLHPAILLYVPSGDGIRLGGVEYAQFDADQDLSTDSDRPSLFGVPFDGPMPGHFPGMPIHYDLHVWIWDHNPSGMFAQFNSSVSCP